MTDVDLTKVDNHFEFGRNWRDFARSIDGAREQFSLDCLQRLTGGRLDGKSFLDIGCGSGLSALSAVRLGVARLHAIDIDAASVETTRALLESRKMQGVTSTHVDSVFALTPQRVGRFDVVHSWGVLHHTGNMWLAIDRAIDLVAEDGRLILALYLKTPFCAAWRLEKRLYTVSPAPMKWLLERTYLLLSAVRKLLGGTNPFRYAKEYARSRGMSWIHDIRDWVGGYPYESVDSEELVRYVERRGFRLERSYDTVPRTGLFGTSCGEWTFRRTR